MKTFLLFAFLTIFSINLIAQSEQSASIQRKTQGVYLGLNGAPSWPIGLSYYNMINERLSFELGAGIFSSGLGVRYYLTNPNFRRFNYYTGSYFMLEYAQASPMYYLPFGISYYSKKDFQYSLDAGIMVSEYIEPFPSPWLGLKMGYRFGKVYNSDNVSPDDEETTLKKKNYIFASMGATSLMFGVIYERIINNYIGLEAGIGILSASAGLKFYPFQLKKNTLNLHFGANHSLFAFVFIGDGWYTYLPVGFDYISEKNYRFSLDAGPMFEWYNNIGSEFDIVPSFNLKFGKGF